MMVELELTHHGVKGQKWGSRRWQYKDGSLTPEGYIHYGYGKKRPSLEREEIARSHNRSKLRANGNNLGKKSLNAGSGSKASDKKRSSNRFDVSLSDEQKRNLKMALGVSAAVAVSAGALYYAKHKTTLKDSWEVNKKLSDFVLKEGDAFQTLSYSQDRVKTGDMFYASHTKMDNSKYKTYYATDFKKILKGEMPPLKYEIKGHMAKNTKVASERSASEVFSRLYRTNPEFKEFVTNPLKMREYYTSRVPRQFSGYKEALKALDRVSGSKNPSEDDLKLVYRLFNYTIPHEESSNARGMFFSELKKSGYGALLDTNDALYGGFHSNSPVIIFDMENVIKDSAEQLRLRDISSSAVQLALNKASFIDTDIVYK